jgi:hypothetical protein
VWKFVFGLAPLFLCACTQIREAEAFDRLKSRDGTPGIRISMRTDGYYWREAEEDAGGKRWKGLLAILFFPGGIHRIVIFTPSVWPSERDTAPDSWNTPERARANFLATLPKEIDPAAKSELNGWGFYRLDADSLRFATLDGVGIAFPLMIKTYFGENMSARVQPDSGFNFGKGWYQFEKLPAPLDSTGLRINNPKFKKKRFPSFFWGW